MSEQGPKGNGDPNFRGMSKMEEDPLVTQRMRDIARTQMCVPYAKAYDKCGGEQVNDLICISCIYI